MSRTYLLLVVGLAVILVVPTEVQAGAVKRGDDSTKSTTKSVTFVDTSTNPATELQNVAVSLQSARTGTLQNSGATLPSSSSLGIVNPDPAGFGDAAFFDVFYTGPANNFPTDSFFDIFVDITQPGTGERGTLKLKAADINPFAVEVTGDSRFLGNPDYLNSFVGQISPAQQGLSFSGLQVVQGSSPDPNANSFFDIFTQLQFNGPGTINPNLPLFEITMAGVPEPSTLVFAAAGVVALMAVARKRRIRG